MSTTKAVTVRQAATKAGRARRLWAAGKKKFATSLMREAHADLQAVRLRETQAFVERMHEVCVTLEGMKATLDRMLEEQRGVLARTEQEDE